MPVCLAVVPTALCSLQPSSDSRVSFRSCTSSLSQFLPSAGGSRLFPLSTDCVAFLPHARFAACTPSSAAIASLSFVPACQSHQHVSVLYPSSASALPPAEGGHLLRS